MDIWYIDAETRSACDLKKRGQYHYMAHPSTDVLCLALAKNDEEPFLWLPELHKPALGMRMVYGPPLPEFVHHVKAGGEVWAHNAIFERLLFRHVMPRYGFPQLAIEQMVCTQILCANMALPMSLENAAAALQLPERKDMEKRKDMVYICKPIGVDPCMGEPLWATPESHPQRFANTYAYCLGDVRVERMIAKEVKALSAFRRKVYIMDQRINDRGMRIDVPAVTILKRLAKIEQDRLNNELRPLCGTTFSQVGKIGEWVKTFGIKVPSLDKHDLADLLALPDLPAEVRKALLIRQEAAKSSVAKLEAMLQRVQEDGRARGCFQMGGAVSTFRWSGRAIQSQNMPRPELPADLIETILDWISRQKEGDDLETLDAIRTLWGRPMSVFSDCLRGLIVPTPGHVLLGPDLVSIEALVSAWLVGDDKKVAFMAAGGDVYKVAARRILGLGPDDPVTKVQRQKGKVSELSSGYQGGKGAVSKMCIQQGLPYPGDTEALRWRDIWREAHPEYVEYWAQVNERAIEAVKNPGHPYSLGPDEARRVTFLFRGKFLRCKTPSGEVLSYPYPKVERGKFGHPAVTYMKSKDRRWFRNHYYGGHGLENITQHDAMMLLAHGMLNLEEEGYPVVTHAHDEGVPEVPILDPEASRARETEVMALFTRRPEWASTLPYSASIFTAGRYRK